MTDAGAVLAAAIAELERPRSATYRFQLGAALGFEQVAALVDYLEALGVSDAYLSPCFKCGPGSSHGYDVTDHNVLNPEIGSPASFDRMAETLRGRGMGIILDIVPNHMGIAGDSNPWWLDVLENGPSSPHASFFDIEWEPPKAELRDKVLLPVLTDQYGHVLESGQLQLELIDGAFVLRCAGARLPIAPDSYARILTHQLDDLGSRLGDDAPHLQELKSNLTALAHLPTRTETDPVRVEERLREKEVVKRRLGALVKSPGRTAPSSRTTSARSTAPWASRPASTTSTRSCPSSPTGSPTGEWRGTRSTTDASSTSTTWRPSAWSAP